MRPHKYRKQTLLQWNFTNHIRAGSTMAKTMTALGATSWGYLLQHKGEIPESGIQVFGELF